MTGRGRADLGVNKYSHSDRKAADVVISPFLP